jgi:hypothetical protein
LTIAKDRSHIVDGVRLKVLLELRQPNLHGRPTNIRECVDVIAERR